MPLIIDRFNISQKCIFVSKSDRTDFRWLTLPVSLNVSLHGSLHMTSLSLFVCSYKARCLGCEGGHKHISKRGGKTDREIQSAHFSH